MFKRTFKKTVSRPDGEASAGRAIRACAPLRRLQPALPDRAALIARDHCCVDVHFQRGMGPIICYSDATQFVGEVHTADWTRLFQRCSYCRLGTVLCGMCDRDDPVDRRFPHLASPVPIWGVTRCNSLNPRVKSIKVSNPLTQMGRPLARLHGSVMERPTKGAGDV